MKPTIAISRLMGSGGKSIAQKVTEALGYTLINRNVLEGIFRQYGLTKFGELYTAPPNLWDLANAKNLQIVSMLNETMEALAYRGQTLVLGRGGYTAISKFADTLNVRLQAPFPVRLERVMRQDPTGDYLHIEQQVKADDVARQKFVSRFYNQSWDDASSFDLVIDTSVISVDTAASWIAEAVQTLGQKEHGERAEIASRAKVDPALLDAIDIALARQIPAE